jgi:hypothetical protein
MPADQELVRLLEQVLLQTDELLERGEVEWDVALQGLEAVAADLARRFPGRDDIIRARIAEWTRNHTH